MINHKIFNAVCMAAFDQDYDLSSLNSKKDFLRKSLQDYYQSGEY